MIAPIMLRRIEPARNMARFYRIQIQPTLFGGFTVVREWGRIGQAGTCRQDQYNTEEAASIAASALRRAKLKRGYQPRCTCP